MRAAAATLLATALMASPTQGQSLSAEVAQTGGWSSAGNAAAATQARVFGDAPLGVTFNVESAWAVRSGDETDAFGAAYPYEGGLQVMEAYGERVFQPGAALLAVRAGRFRPPFGIYGGSDHAYSGFLRAPLIRYDDYWALSNTFLENGVSVVAGVPKLFVETAVGAPGDVGEAVRPSGVDRIVRLQASFRSVILGASHISTRPFQSPTFAHGRATFSGVDGRWMRGGVELRGEWIAGQPFDGTHAAGGYLDVRVHRPALGPVTAVLRVERLGYDAPEPFQVYAHRYTFGGKVRLLDPLSAQVNVIRQDAVPEQGRSAVDLSLTYVYRFDSKRTR